MSGDASTKPRSRWPFMSTATLPPRDDSDDPDAAGDAPFCDCGTEHGIEERDWNRCGHCGRPLQ